MLNKTWYRNEVFFLITGVYTFFQIRDNGRGGGVSLQVSRSDYRIIPDCSITTKE